MANNFSLDFLPDQLDGLIYCPGSINLRPFERIKEEDFLNDYKLQVLGAIKSIQAVISRLKKSEIGSIVLFSIRVNCVAPSLTDTPLAFSLLNTEQKIEANAQRHPLKRIGTTDDIANIVEFLVSSKASWITGQIIHVDGGISTLKT